MKRVRDVFGPVSTAATARQQVPAQPNFLAELHSKANSLVCELVTALRAAGVDSTVDGCKETGNQDRLVEYLVVREFIQLLNHVVAGTQVLLRTATAAASSDPPLPSM